MERFETIGSIPSTIIMKQQLEEFYQLLDTRVQVVWEAPSTKDHLVALVQSLQLLCEKVRHIGNFGIEAFIMDLPEEEEVVRTFVLYQWVPAAKNHLILWRDVIFQVQKAMILHQDEEVSDQELDRLISSSRITMVDAATYIKEYFDKRTPQYLKNEKSRKDYLSDQSLIANPWPIYQEQINVLEAQSHSLFDQYEKVSATDTLLKSLVKRIQEIINSFEHELDRIRTIGEEVRSLTADHADKGHQRLIRHITSVEEQALAFNHANSYHTVVEQTITDMVGKVDVPIRLDKTRIVHKEIDFAQGVKVWLHGEVRPHIIEAQEILASIGNSMKMSLINVKNRALVSGSKEEGEQVQLSPIEYTQPLQTVLDTIAKKQEAIKEINKRIGDRILSKLHLKRIYLEDRVFLDSSQQYVISQLKLDQTAWIQRLRNWVWEKAMMIREFMAKVAKEESLSISEKLVRYIDSRKSEDDNQQYANIFSTQGYIGESFWVGREEERRHMAQLIEQWKNGYRGSVIISGKRLCGKTVFGELIAHRFFADETIRLRPFSTLKFSGRTITLKDDIKEGIEFIRKYAGQKKQLIWIDDLELWQSVQVPASQNIRVLLESIDSLSTQMFFMVSMSNWFRHHYNQMFLLEKVFQAEINLDYMTDENIKRAISIRHGATHKLLVDEENHQLPSHEFNNLVVKVSKLGENNIGQSLNLWSYFTHHVDEERVIHRPNYAVQLPNFLNDENSILLRAILMSKRTNEYRLRKTFGRAFGDKYRSIVMRLIALGLLVRHMDGLLEVNEAIVNEVAAFLDQGGYIKYKYKG